MCGNGWDRAAELLPSCASTKLEPTFPLGRRYAVIKLILHFSESLRARFVVLGTW
jgi:hypothetical protein